EEDRLHVITEAAALRIGLMKRAPDQSKAKLLRQIVRRVRVPERPQEIAMDRPAVALQEDVLGLGRGVGWANMRLAQNGPHGRNPAETLIETLLCHENLPID